jgi:hypothetical protein
LLGRHVIQSLALVGSPMFADAKYEVTATASGAGRGGKTTLADGAMFLDLVIAKELERLVAMAHIPRSLSAKQFRLLPAKRVIEDEHQTDWRTRQRL